MSQAGSVDIMSLIERAQRGDKDARERVIEENLRLVSFSIKRYLGRGVAYEDLYQIGCIGLIKAVNGFDTTMGTRFSTYAVQLISGEAARFLRDDGAVHVSRTIKQNARIVESARNMIWMDEGKEATVRDIENATGLTRDEVVLALAANRQVLSLDMPMGMNGDDGGKKIEDTLVAESWEHERVNIGEMLKHLPAMHRKIIECRFFMDMTQGEISKELGISQAQVSRLEGKILLELRGKIKG